MRRLAAIALALAAAVTAAGARADTYAILPTPQAASGGILPSAFLPNAPGSVALPASLSTPPATPERLSSTELLSLWQGAGAAYGVPWQVLAAINEVESDFGRNMGPSSAGAVGWMQFMPSTWLEWGVDASGDGVADPWNPQDAVYSAARYLAAAGAATDVAQAVYAYNHADWYVQEVLALAGLYGQGSAVAFSLDRVQRNLDAARADVADASAALVAAQERARQLGAEVARWQRRADAETLLSSRLADEQRAGAVRDLLGAAQARVRQATETLRTARSRLAGAQSAAAPTSFAPGLSPLLGTPSYSSGWAFPVGGGPSVVSVGHTHHDYPAADIAAPAGSPVYALADGVVAASWPAPNGACGIGFVYRTTDGQEWTYCHLAYLEPSVVAGASLTAGTGVGLVGSTGDATGPHLHLQLDPPTSYPQDEAWFQTFAGTAFSWQDAAPAATGQPLRFLAAVPAAPAPTNGGRVFAVVPADATPVVLFDRPGG